MFYKILVFRIRIRIWIRICMIRIFWASWIRIRIRNLFVRIRIRKSKRCKKTLISTVLRLLYDFLSLKNDVNVPSKRNKRKRKKITFFVGVFKISDENSRIRIRPRIRFTWSQVRIRGSESASGPNVTDLEHVNSEYKITHT
jgi:hypothetical protein